MSSAAENDCLAPPSLRRRIYVWAHAVMWSCKCVNMEQVMEVVHVQANVFSADARKRERETLLFQQALQSKKEATYSKILGARKMRSQGKGLENHGLWTRHHFWMLQDISTQGVNTKVQALRDRVLLEPADPRTSRGCGRCLRCRYS